MPRMKETNPDELLEADRVFNQHMESRSVLLRMTTEGITDSVLERVRPAGSRK